MSFKLWAESLDNRIPYWTSCPSTYEWVIFYLNDHSEQIDWNEFKKATHWEDEVAGLGYRIPKNPKINKGGLWFHKDWSVTFHKVDPQAVEGQQIYFFGWSGMEYIFATTEGQEALIRKAKEAWMNDGNDVEDD